MPRLKGEGQSISTQVEADDALVGKYLIGDGLALKVTEKNGSRYGNYVLRIQHQGKRHDVSIGSLKKVKLAEAKNLAAKARLAVLAGEDPKAAIGRKVVVPTTIDFKLAAVVARCFETKRSSLKGDGEAGKWLSPLRVHILPKLGTAHVSEIDANAIVRVLKPIWHEKPEAAKKAINRLSAALENADLEQQGIIVDGAASRAKKLLGKQVRQVRHIPSTPYADLPDLYQRICRLNQTPSVLALRLCLLTGQRLQPVRMAVWSEFNLKSAVWTIPAENLKGEKGKTEDYRCPLSPEAVRVVQLAQRLTNRNELFPAQRGNGVISGNGILKILDKLNEVGRPHGFRSTFGDWAGSHNVSFELAEKCLQHAYGSAVSRAYRREDRLDDRRVVMDDWAQHAISARDEAVRGNLRVVE
jgi:integrase